MARKQSIENLIHTELKNKIAFGESKHLDKKNLGFGESNYKIYSYNTYDTYLKECKNYATWLKEEKNINKISDLRETEQYAKEYIQHQLDSGVSVYTAKMERSALGMLYSRKIEIDLPKRDNKAITRSRNNSNSHYSREGQYKDVFAVALATGGRRSDILKLSADSFIEKDGHLYVKFEQSKGGRDRLSFIRDEYKQQVLEVIEKAKESGKTRLIEHIPKHMDIHSLRREYAKNLYKDITKDRQLRDDILKNYKPRMEYKNNKEIKSKFYTDRDKNKYERDDIYIISQSLGHNRLDVSVTHYLK